MAYQQLPIRRQPRLESVISPAREQQGSVATNYENRANVSNQSNIQTIQRDLNIYQVSQEDVIKQESKECLENLLLIDPREVKDSLKGRKGGWTNGTCEWILTSAELVSWHNSQSSDSNIFWLYGHPGTGKSTIALFLVESFEVQFEASKDNTLIYFFCDSGSDSQNTATQILRGLLYQLCLEHEGLLDRHLLPEYRTKKKKLFESVEGLWRIFNAMLADDSVKQLYCIIDALDECEDESRDVFLQQLTQTYGNSTSNRSAAKIRLLVTSRPYFEIDMYLSDFSTKDIGTFEEIRSDVKLLIDNKIAKLTKRGRISADLQREITNILESKAEGTFLWVGLACAELTRGKARDAIKILNKLPAGLNSIYESLLVLIEKEEEANVIKQVLEFVAIALKPITLAELAVACRLHEDERGEDRERFTEDVVDLCRSMIVLDNENKSVRLLHKSVKDFLFKDAADHFSTPKQVHANTTNRCIDYLLETFALTSSLIPSNHAFLEYATRFWPLHARQAEHNYRVNEKQVAFFRFQSAPRERWLDLSASWGEDLPLYCSMFHVIAKWGLLSLLDFATSSSFFEGTGREASAHLSLTDFTDAFDRFGANPLEIAVARSDSIITCSLLKLTATEDLGKVQITRTEDKHSDDGHGFATRVYRFPVTREVLSLAAKNNVAGHENVALLLHMRTKEFVLCQDIMVDVVKNQKCGIPMLQMFFENCPEKVTLNKTVALAAMSNEKNGTEMLRMLLDNRAETITDMQDFTETIVQGSDINTIASHLNRHSKIIKVTRRLLEVLAANTECRHAAMKLMLGWPLDRFELTKGLIEVIAQHYDLPTMKILLPESNIIVDESVLERAARNRKYGHEMTMMLLKCADQSFISNVSLKAAARNRNQGAEILRCLLDHANRQTFVASGVLETALRNPEKSSAAVDVLLTHSNVDLRITDSVFKAASEGLDKCSRPFIQLLKQTKFPILVTAQVLFTASHPLTRSELESLVLKTNPRIDHTPELLRIAARYYSVAVLNVLLETCDSQMRETLNLLPSAAKGGNILVMEKLLAEDETQRVDNKARIGQALLVAAECREVKAVQLLLREGADPNTRGGIYGSALQAAVARGGGDAIYVLIDGGANVNARGGVLGSALQAAADNANVDSVRILLERGADVHIRGGHYGTALNAAITMAEYTIISMILDRGVQLDDDDDVELKNALQSVAVQGESSILRFLIEKGIPVNARGGDHGSLLQAAVHGGHMETVQLLLDHGANVNPSNSRLGSPLHAAALQGDTRLLQMLIHAGARPVPGQTLINSAVEARVDQRPIISLLLRCGADIAARDKDGATCLHTAVRTALPICQLLHAAGSDIHARTGDGDSVLYLAALSGRSEIVKWLISLGANVNDANKQGFTPLHGAVTEDITTAQILYKAGAGLFARSSGGRSVLHEAAMSGQAGIVKWLLSLGADVNDIDDKGFSIMHSAVLQDLATAKIVHEAGASASAKSEQGTPVINEAAGNGKVKIVEWLISLGVSVHDQDANGFTPLLLAAAIDISTVEVLQAAGGNLHATNRFGYSVLQRAALADQTETVRMLIRAGLDVHHVDVEHWTSLHHAAYSGSDKAVELLLDYGANIDALTSCGQTPLMLAIINSKDSTACDLVDAGADLTICDSYGKTAIGWLETLHTNDDLFHILVETTNSNNDIDYLRVHRWIEAECTLLLADQDALSISSSDQLGNRFLMLSRFNDEHDSPAHGSFNQLGHRFLMLNDEENALLAFGLRILPSSLPDHRTHSIRCDGCQMYPIEGSRFVCKICPDTDLCSTCRRDVGDGLKMDICKHLEFMEVSSLLPKLSDAAAVENWLRRVIKKYSAK